MYKALARTDIQSFFKMNKETVVLDERPKIL